MVEQILGGGQKFFQLGWVDCPCAKGCEGHDRDYFIGYSDGYLATKNPP